MEYMNGLSIIIPVFNGEKSIYKCVNSIENNTNITYEIIIVDDCSTDNTCEIIDEIMKYNKRIKLIKNKNNIGVSASRNIGIKFSKYKFITFVDCDDYIINNIYDNIIKNDSEFELFIFNYYEEKDDIKFKSKYYLENIDLNSNKAIDYALLDKIPLSVWSCIFNKSIIKNNNICFNEKVKIGEDNLFVLEYISYAKIIKTRNIYGYVYKQNDSSVMHNLNENILQLNNITKYFSKNLQKKVTLNKDSYKVFISICNMKCIHAICNSNDHRKLMYLSKIYDKQKLKYIIKGNIYPKYMRIEAFNLFFFGRHIHLILYPFYCKIKKIVRRK